MIEPVLQEFLESRLAAHPVSRLVVGLSAGLDSTALLQAVVAVRNAQAPGLDLLAVHVHHGLSANADAWASQALATARQLGVRCEVLRVTVGRAASLEAEARQARYAVFRSVLGKGDALLLAQHRDDQAETVLFRLARGAGVRGLGAMRAEAELKPGVPLWRPLLAVSRQQLEHYAADKGLNWVEDESNADTRFARNFLRQRIIPELRRHWPEIDRTLAATAQRMQEADMLLGEYARQLLATIGLPDGAISVPGLLTLTVAQRRLVLRERILEKQLPIPEERILEQIERDVLPAAADATPLVAWAGGECRRYREGLYLLSPLPAVPGAWEAAWSGEPLVLPDGRRLVARNWPWSGQQVLVRFRRGGEKIRPVGSPHLRDLKTLLQEAGIPPWERERLPLVFVGGVLVAVAGRWYADAGMALQLE